MRIKELAELTGVSVRTLRYYDEIGLLKPSSIDKWTGYRFYDGDALARMQEILFYRELDFSLKSICQILSSPDYDRQKALDEQKRLLVLKKQRLERLLDAIDDAKKGSVTMNAFDKREFEAARSRYEAEAKERWGHTDAYREQAEKTKDYTEKQHSAYAEEMMKIFDAFADCMRSGARPEDEQAQNLVRTLQDHITQHYYTCTREILEGLGEMYTSDERFRKNIDRSADGTAQFAAQAIRRYCH